MRRAFSNMRRNRKAVLVSSGSVLLVRVSGALLQALTLLLLAHWYPVRLVGSYAAIYTVWALARHIGPLGLDQTCLRFIPVYLEEDNPSKARAFELWSRRLVFAVSVGFSAALASTLVVAVAVLGAQWTMPTVALLAAGVPLYSLHGLYANQLRSRGLMARAQIPESGVLPLCGIGFMGVAKLAGVNDLAPIVGTGVSAAVVTLALYVRSWSAVYLVALRESPAGHDFGPERRASFEIWLGQLTMGLAVKLPVILTAMKLGSEAAAKLEVALRLQSALVLIASAIVVVASPLFSKAYASGDKGRLQDLLLGFSWLTHSLPRPFLRWVSSGPVECYWEPLALPIDRFTVRWSCWWSPQRWMRA